MNNQKNLLLVCILLLSATKVFADFDEPEIVEYDEVPPVKGGRMLSDYSNIRIATDFEHVTVGSSSFIAYLKGELVPAVVDYLQAALKIKYPLTSKITSSASTLCGFSTPAVLSSGVDADVFIFFNTKYDSTGGWMAATTLCTLSSGVKRPIIVNIGVNTYSFAVADVDSTPLKHDLYINVITHEFVHALGMNGALYKYFVDDDGDTLTDHIKSVTLSGTSRTVLDLDPLTTKLQEYYDCDTVPGLFMENSNDAHIERRFFQWEIMSTGGVMGSRISFVSLGFLEGTGWYVPDYDYAEPYHFGKGKGCEFLADSIDSTDYPNEYCTGSDLGCTEVGNGGGYCVSDSLIEVGKVVTAQYAFNCENPSGVYYVPFSSKQVFGRGLSSKCFSGNLTTSKTATVDPDPYCLNATCVGSGASTVVSIMWGTTQFNCTAEGPISLLTYRGYFNCPDPQTFCSTVGVDFCPRNCMGRGTCTNAKCVCDDGYQGTDCGFTA